MTADEFSTRASVAFMSGFALGVIFTFSDWANSGTFGTLGLAAGSAVIVGLVGWKVGINQGAALVVVLWLVCLGVQTQLADHDVWATLGVPFVISSSAVAALRTRRVATVARSAPLVLPVALTVLVVPLFTADLWSTADLLQPANLVLVAIVTLAPLLVAAERRLGTRVDLALTERAAAIDPDGALEEVKETLARLLPDEEREQARADITRLLPRVWEPFEPQLHVSQLVGPLRSLLTRNLLTATVGVMTVATLYMAALAWVLIPVAKAREWTGAFDVHTLAALGVQIAVPLGPYISVAVVLGVLATAVLLATVVVDEDYADRLADALLRQPAGSALGVAVPYLHMREEAPPGPPPG